MAGNEVLPEIIAETAALQAVRELFEADAFWYRTLGADPPRTLLLSGPPGVGKSKAVRIAARETGLSTFSVTPGPHVSNALRIAFRDALATVSERKACAKGSRAVVFIDEIDAVCPAPSKSSPDTTMSIATSILLSFIDPPPQTRSRKLRSTIFVVAATNRPDAVHPSLRRAGRFDREAILSPPSASERYKILCALESEAEYDVLHDVANRAIGFVAADLADLCRTARTLEDDLSKLPSETQREKPTSHRNFMLALKRTRPSVLRSAIAAEIPVASWDEVGGLSQVKKRLKMAVEWPLLHADTFERLGLKAPRGILLHGPPGCSKTTLVRVAASQGNASFLRLNGADIYSCYLGEAERILREGFAMARAAAPCILFLDEIDAIVGKRSIDGSKVDGNGVQERVLSTLLTEMDGIVSASGVLVIGATNRVDLLDDALLRPGRFDDILEVPMPDDEARLEILRIHTAKFSLGEDVNLEIMARQTAGKSGAEIASICTEAGLAALREIYVTASATQSHSSWNASLLSITSRHFHFERSEERAAHDSIQLFFQEAALINMAISESSKRVYQLRERLNSALHNRRERGLLRQLRAPKATVCDFSSNDYLGLARSESFQSFFQKVPDTKKEVEVLSLGATGSRLLSGHSQLVEDLEVTASTFHRAEAALVFNSGYDANISVLSCVPGPADAIVYDELIHASVHDGMRMSRARSRLIPFTHNDVESLKEAVKTAATSCSGSILICIETVYSMEGDIAPVRDILSLADSMGRRVHREVHVLADEAHGAGIYGENGEGVICELGAEKHGNLLLRVVTFGKAFGAHGAVVLGSQALRQYLINYARPFIYSTALPPHSVLVLGAVYLFMKSIHMKAARQRLWELVGYFHELRSKLLPETAVINHGVTSPIQAVLVPGNHECVQVSNKLRSRGFDVYPIRSPTVPKGAERIRIVIHAHNNVDEIRRMLLTTAQALEELHMRGKL